MVGCGRVWYGKAGRARYGGARYGEARQVLGQDAEGSANTRKYFIIGAEGPLHIGD